MRARWLCDTNVVSELMRPKPNEAVVTQLEGEEVFAVSVVTVEEIRSGLAYRDGRRQTEWFERFLDERCEVLPVTRDVARRAGDIRGHLRARGFQRTQADMIIAATALIHDLVVVTRNTIDFEHCQLQLLNPFPV